MIPGVPGSPMHLAVFEELPSAPGFASEWDGLAFSTGHHEVFYSYSWHAAMYSAFADRLRPLILTARDCTGTLVGIAGLAIDASRPSVAVLAGYIGADYEDLICGAAECEPFVTAVLQLLQQRGLDLRFSRLPATSGTAQCLPRATKAAGYRVLREDPWVAPMVSFADPDVRDHLRKKLEHSSRRWENRLARAGLVRIDHWLDWPSVQARLPEFFEMHVGRFLTSGRTSFFLEPARREFITDLARRLCPSGDFVYSEIRVNGSAVAASVGFIRARRWFFYLPTFDPEWARSSPGYLLLKHVLRASIDRPDVDVLDLGIGNEDYKLRLANDSTEVLRFRLSRTVARHAEAYMKQAVWPAIAGSEILHKALLSIRARLAFRLPPDARESDRRDVRLFSDIGDLRLVPSTPRLLARAALASADDRRSLTALVRATNRGDLADTRAFALVRETGDVATPVHFTWLETHNGDTATVRDSWTLPGLPASLLAAKANELAKGRPARQEPP